MEKLVRGLISELSEAIPDATALTGFTIPPVEILGYSITTNDFNPGVSTDFKLFGGEIIKPTLMVKREGGIRFDPMYYSRAVFLSFAGNTDGEVELKLCWDIDNVVALAMERLGVFRYKGQKFGSPVGESDGIPAYNDGIKRWYVYRSFLIASAGPVALA